MTGIEWGAHFIVECVTLFFKMLVGGVTCFGLLFGLAWLAVCPARWGESIRKRAEEREVG